MKKFVLLTILGLILFLNDICFAYYDPNYDPYEEDTNYRLVFAIDDARLYYLDLRTVDVLEYNPPHYKIAGDFVDIFRKGANYVNHDESRNHVTIIYNYLTKETYSKDRYHGWKKDDVHGDNIIPSMNRAFANALFIVAYNMKFYN